MEGQGSHPEMGKQSMPGWLEPQQCCVQSQQKCSHVPGLPATELLPRGPSQMGRTQGLSKGTVTHSLCDPLTVLLLARNLGTHVLVTFSLANQMHF